MLYLIMWRKLPANYIISSHIQFSLFLVSRSPNFLTIAERVIWHVLEGTCLVILSPPESVIFVIITCHFLNNPDVYPVDEWMSVILEALFFCFSGANLSKYHKTSHWSPGNLVVKCHCFASLFKMNSLTFSAIHFGHAFLIKSMNIAHKA